MENEIRRGDIYFIHIEQATGHEMKKTRPGIVVSSDRINKKFGVVTVVMCSGSASHRIPGHVVVLSTPIPSVAMCEHIYTVDRSRIGRYLGRCTEDEMAGIQAGMESALGLLLQEQEESGRGGQHLHELYETLYKGVLDRIGEGEIAWRTGTKGIGVKATQE